MNRHFNWSWRALWSSALIIICLTTLGARQPNVVLIYADDLGYGDPGCYGGELVPTPNIDRLAREGVRFTQGYSNASVCAPARAGMLSGAYQQRFGMQINMDRRKYRIPESQPILMELFRDAGYRTGAIAKWNIIVPPERAVDEMHLRVDWEADFWPIGDGPRKGEYIGVDEERWDWTRAKHVDSSKQSYWGPKREGDVYLTDLIADTTLDFIERHQDQPFMFYLAFNAVHTPLQAKKAYEARVMHIADERLRLYACMLISMDEAVGQVLDSLDELGLTDETIVAFLSDNGPARGPIKGWPEHWRDDRVMLGSTGGLRGQKGTFYEGGIRVPFILRWPGKLEAGVEYDQAVSALDLYPTFAEAAGVPIPESAHLDGVNLLPYLLGEAEGRPHERLFWKAGDHGAVLHGDHKLIVGYAGEPELFNLEKDRNESNNLASAQPEKAGELLTIYQNWEAGLPPSASEAKPN